MRRTAILMLVLSMFLGVLAVYLARDWVQEQVASAKKVETTQVELTTVVVAKRPLHFGDELSSSALDEVSWPANSLPPGSFGSIGELVGKGERRVVLKAIQMKEPILKSKVSGFGGRATLSTIIDQEFRAVTIRVNDVNGVAGFVLPGDRVDVLLTRSPKGTNEQITDVMMQNVKVLGVDQDAAEDKDKPKVVRAVTLEVTTEQSQKLTLAQTVGQLALTLRGATNNEPIAHRRIREKDLVDERFSEDQAVSADVATTSEPKPVKKVVRARPQQSQTSVRVYRGTEPKVHDVPSEAPTTRITGPVAAPRQLVPQKSVNDGGPAADKKLPPADAPISSGPIPLVPGSATKHETLPVPENPVAPKTRDSTVQANTPRSLVMGR